MRLQRSLAGALVRFAELQTRATRVSVVGLGLILVLASCAQSPVAPSLSSTQASTESRPAPTERANFVAGQEALITNTPAQGDAWRLVVDSLVRGKAATDLPGASNLSALPSDKAWLSLRVGIRYVGASTPTQVLDGRDFSVFYQIRGVNYESRVVAGWPSLEVRTAKDKDTGLTLWFATPKQPSVEILLWSGFGQGWAAYQWDLTTSPEPRPSLPRTEWGPPESTARQTFTGKKNWVLGTDFQNTNPPDGILLVEWEETSDSTGCGIWIKYNASGSEGSVTNVDAVSGRDLLRRPAFTGPVTREWILNVTATCPWKVSVSGVGTLFGPNTQIVADFMARSSELGPGWETLDTGGDSAITSAARADIRALAAGDANVAAALGNALAPDWYVGNHFIDDHPATRDLRADAISALVLAGVLPRDEELALYAPFGSWIPREVLGTDLP